MNIALNLKSKDGIKIVKKIIDSSDVLIEGFRPGVMEKLGIGPSNCHDKLIYGRMTGWGQVGKFSKTAGHDINYLGITGALHAIGNDERPIPPLNLVADYGGGSMFLIFGILAALYERNSSGNILQIKDSITGSNNHEYRFSDFATIPTDVVYFSSASQGTSQNLQTVATFSVSSADPIAGQIHELRTSVKSKGLDTNFETIATTKYTEPSEGVSFTYTIPIPSQHIGDPKTLKIEFINTK